MGSFELPLMWMLALIGLLGGSLLLLATHQTPRRSATLLSLSYLMLAPVVLTTLADLPLQGRGLSQASINNSLFLLSSALGLAAIRAMRGVDPWTPALLGGLALALLGNLLLSWPVPDQHWRLTLFNLALAGLRVAAAVELWRLYRQEATSYAMVWGIVLAVEALIALPRAAIAASGALPVFGPLPEGPVAWSWVLVLIGTLLHAPLFVLTQLSRDASEQRRVIDQLQRQLTELPDTYLEVNPAERILGLRGPPAALGITLPSPVGSKLADCCPEPVLQALRQAMQQGPSASFGWSISGIPRRFEVTASNPGSSKRGTCSMLIRETTGRHRLEHQLHFRNRLFDHFFVRAPIGLLLSRLSDNAVVDANPALCMLLGWPEGPRADTPIASLVAERDHALLLKIRSELLESGRSGPHELSLQRDGAAATVRIHAILIQDERGQNLSWALIEDVGEQRRVEQMQSSFLGMVSHELRTPLASVIGALDLIDHPAVREIPAKSNQLLTIARESVEKLRNQVEDLLDLNRLLDHREGLELSLQALAPTLGAALERVRFRAAQRQIHIEIINQVPQALAQIDAERLIRALTQLLHNAIRHSPECGTVRLSLSASTPERLRLTVQDQGEGVPLQLQAVLFDKFSQGTGGSTRLPGGSGLGLAIVRETALRHHGEAGYAPGPTGGACFYIELPKATHPTDAQPTC